MAGSVPPYQVPSNSRATNATAGWRRSAAGSRRRYSRGVAPPRSSRRRLRRGDGGRVIRAADRLRASPAGAAAPARSPSRGRRRLGRGPRAAPSSSRDAGAAPRQDCKPNKRRRARIHVAYRPPARPCRLAASKSGHQLRHPAADALAERSSALSLAARGIRLRLTRSAREERASARPARQRPRLGADAQIQPPVGALPRPGRRDGGSVRTSSIGARGL